MSTSKIKLTDFILLLLQRLELEGQSLLTGRTMAQKVIYLITRDTPLRDTLGLHYRIHYYGPYSSEVTEAIESLTTFGLVEEVPTRFTDFTRYDLRLTKQGKEHSNKIYEGLPKAMKDQIESMAREGTKLNAMPLQKVIEKAYAQAKVEKLV
jgi:uncharacterized protein YwgA